MYIHTAVTPSGIGPNAILSCRHFGFSGGEESRVAKLLASHRLWLGCLCVGAVPLAGRRRTRRLWLTVLGLTVAGLLLAFGCGGGGSSSVPGASPPSPVLPSGKI